MRFFLIIIGICLSIFIILLVKEIIKIIRNVDNTDINNVADDIGAVCFFLAPSIVFLILIILELIN